MDGSCATKQAWSLKKQSWEHSPVYDYKTRLNGDFITFCHLEFVDFTSTTTGKAAPGRGRHSAFTDMEVSMQRSLFSLDSCQRHNHLTALCNGCWGGH